MVEEGTEPLQFLRRCQGRVLPRRTELTQHVCIELAQEPDSLSGAEFGQGRGPVPLRFTGRSQQHAVLLQRGRSQVPRSGVGGELQDGVGDRNPIVFRRLYGAGDLHVAHDFGSPLPVRQIQTLADWIARDGALDPDRARASSVLPTLREMGARLVVFGAESTGQVTPESKSSAFSQSYQTKGTY